MTTPRRKRAFTLIELIVVVTIIFILVIIAIPNLTEAQTRARVSAVKNNMRTVATKFEMLGMDSNRYPLAGKWLRMLLYRVIFWLEATPEEEERFTKAYKTLYGPFDDVFQYAAPEREMVLNADWLPVSEHGYLAHGFGFFHPQMMIDALNAGCEWEDGDVENWIGATELAGGWMLMSPGPDRVVECPSWLYIPGGEVVSTRPSGYVEKNLFIEYDPTNGTVSYGNIFRTQKNPGGLGTNERLQ